MSKRPLKINSVGYWDRRFRTDWTDRGGPSQTRFFARVFVDNLPPWIAERLRKEDASFVDLGCALGDGFDILKGAVNPRGYLGLDISKAAISQARAKTSEAAFQTVSPDWSDLPQAENIYLSNTLEHLPDWRERLDLLGSKALGMVFILVPYREGELEAEHVGVFELSTFPIELADGKRLSYCRVIPTSSLPGSRWNGAQLLVVYAPKEKASGEPSPRQPDLQNGVDLRGLTAPALKKRLAAAENPERPAGGRSDAPQPQAGGQVPGIDDPIAQANASWSERFNGMVRSFEDKQNEIVADYDQRLLAKQAELGKLQSDAAAERQQHALEKAELTARVRVAEERQADLRQLHEQKTELAVAQAELRKERDLLVAEVENKRLIGEHAALTAELQSAREEGDADRRARDSLAEELRALRPRLSGVAALEAEIARLRVASGLELQAARQLEAERRALEEQLRAREEEMARLGVAQAQAVSDLQGSAAAAARRLAHAVSERERLSDELGLAQDRSRQLEGRLEETLRDADHQRTRAQLLEENAAAIRDQHERDVQALNRDLARTASDAVEAESERKRLSEALDHIEERRRQTEGRLDETLREAAHQRSLARLHEDNAAAIKDHYERHLQTLNRDLDRTASEAIDAVRNSLTSLREDLDAVSQASADNHAWFDRMRQLSDRLARARAKGLLGQAQHIYRLMSHPEDLAFPDGPGPRPAAAFPGAFDSLVATLEAQLAGYRAGENPAGASYPAAPPREEAAMMVPAAVSGSSGPEPSRGPKGTSAQSSLPPGAVIALQLEVFDAGGLEQVVFDLCRGFRDAGQQAMVVCAQHSGRLGARLASQGIEVFEAQGDIGRYKNRLKEAGVTHLLLNHSYFGFDAAAELGLAVYDIVHNYYFWRLPQRDQMRSIASRCEKIICVSSEVRSFHAAQFDVPMSKTAVIHNAVSLEGFIVPDPAQLSRIRASSNETVLLNVANMYPTKAQVAMLRSFADAHRDQPELRLRIVGAPVLEDILRKMEAIVAAEKLEGVVTFAGHCDRRTLSRHYAQAHAFLLPSIYEGYSVSLVEAAAFGLPIIATDVGGAGEVVANGVGGVLLPRIVDDMASLTPELVDAIGLAERNPVSSAMTAEMVAFARARGHRLSQASAASQTKSLEEVVSAYLEVLAGEVRHRGT